MNCLVGCTGRPTVMTWSSGTVTRRSTTNRLRFRKSIAPSTCIHRCVTIGAKLRGTCSKPSTTRTNLSNCRPTRTARAGNSKHMTLWRLWPTILGSSSAAALGSRSILLCQSHSECTSRTGPSWRFYKLGNRIQTMVPFPRSSESPKISCSNWSRSKTRARLQKLSWVWIHSDRNWSHPRSKCSLSCCALASTPATQSRTSWNGSRKTSCVHICLNQQSGRCCMKWAWATPAGMRSSGTAMHLKIKNFVFISVPVWYISIHLTDILWLCKTKNLYLILTFLQSAGMCVVFQTIRRRITIGFTGPCWCARVHSASCPQWSRLTLRTHGLFGSICAWSWSICATPWRSTCKPWSCARMTTARTWQPGC